MIPKRRFGPGGPMVPILGQGTWNMERDDRAEAIRALRRGIDLGLTHIDTAELYGGGEVESLVGEAIAGRRDQLFLVSKVLPTNASRRGTVRACEASLRRLGTDALDCYLLHWPGPHPLEDTFAAFDELLGAGKIRAFGVSNFDVEDLDEAVRLAAQTRGTVACNQVLYHLGERHIEAQLLERCRSESVALVGYSPFGSGAFPPAGAKGRKVLAEVAEAHGATVRQVALAFLSREEGVFLIPKAATTAHVEDNAGAAGLQLTAEDVRRVDAAFPLRLRRELPVI